jgi:hypothetical protein
MTPRILTITATAAFALLTLAASPWAGTADEQTRELVQHRYAACLAHASFSYIEAFRSSCDEACAQKKPLESCMMLHNSWNTAICSLPLSVTDKQDQQLEDKQDQQLERDKDRCLREFQAGVTEMVFD